jgi:O-antigen/teichoic acid export membrane protein
MEAKALSKSGSVNRSLLFGAVTNWAAFAATLAVGFFLAPYLVRSLGDARYGVWCVVESILAYFTLFDLGIAACLVRFVAKHHATGERGELNRIVSACCGLFLLAASGVLILGGVITPFIAPGLERKLGTPGDVLPFMLLMLANLAITLPLSVFPSILDGLQRFGAKSAVRLVCLVLRVGGIVWVMETRPDLLPLAFVFTVTNLLEHTLMALLCFRFLSGLKLSTKLIDRETLREVRGYSVDAFLAMLAGRITVQTGAVIVGGFLTVASAAHYALAARLVELAKNLLRSATITLTPAVSEREATGDFDGVRRVLLDGTRWVLYLVLPIHLGLLAFGRPFFARWVGGPQYAEWCFPAMAVLSATLTIGVAQSVASRILYGMGKLKLFARLALVEAAVNLALSLALVGPFGIVGVAAAVAVPNVLFCLFVITYACRTLNVGAQTYLFTSWLKPLSAACVPAAVWLVLVPAEASWLSIALGVLAGLGPYACAVVGMEWIAASQRRARWNVLVTPVSSLQSTRPTAEA